MTLPAFTSFPDRSPLHVNPLRVNVVKQYAPGYGLTMKHLVVCFDDDRQHRITVPGPVPDEGMTDIASTGRLGISGGALCIHYRPAHRARFRHVRGLPYGRREAAERRGGVNRSPHEALPPCPSVKGLIQLPLRCRACGSQRGRGPSRSPTITVLHSPRRLPLLGRRRGLAKLAPRTLGRPAMRLPMPHQLVFLKVTDGDSPNNLL
jgi:hypothetical protein